MHVIALTNRQALYLPAALKSLINVTGWDRLTIVDDSGSEQWRHELATRYPTANVIAVDTIPAGYTAAMHAVWSTARNIGGKVLLLEEDFTIDAPINLEAMACVLDANPNLAQLVLQRQPWYPVEHRRGLIGAQRHRGHTFTQHDGWISHNAGFYGNPSLIAEAVFDLDWPTGAWTEDAMGARLKHAGFTFGYWGHEGDRHVTHHGHQRAETSKGY